MFGQSVNFLFDGEEQTTSWIGALVSIVIISLTLTFGSNKFTGLRRRTDTEFASFTDVGEQKKEFSYEQKDGIEMAF